MTALHRLLSLVFVGAGLSTSCLGTETGNPGKTITIGLAARTSDAKVASTSTGEGGLVITSAWLAVERIEVVACNSTTETYTLLDRLTRDAVNPGALLKVTLPEGNFCAVRVQITPLLSRPDGAPAGLDNSSFWLTGKRSDNISITARSTLNFAAELRSSTALTFDTDVLVALDLAQIFKNIPANTMVVTDPAGLSIDPSRGSDLTQRLDQNLPQSLTLHRDVNGNGSIDAEDQQPIATP